MGELLNCESEFFSTALYIYCALALLSTWLVKVKANLNVSGLLCLLVSFV